MGSKENLATLNWGWVDELKDVRSLRNVGEGREMTGMLTTCCIILVVCQCIGYQMLIT